MSTGVSFWNDKNVLKLVVMRLCNCEYIKNTTLKWITCLAHELS
jgi:hypothetical protein